MAKEKIIGIYCIENIVNGKKYIGQSTRLNVRYNEHKSALNRNKRNNTYFQHSWNKYGEKNFIYYILEYCGINELDNLERYYIQLYKTNSREYGYNTESGGSLFKSLSDEQKAKISKNHADVSGKNNPFYGKKHSKEKIDSIINNEGYKNRKYIGEDSHFAKLSLEEATYIKKYLNENIINFNDEKVLAEQFNVSISAIQKIKHNRTWKQILI